MIYLWPMYKNDPEPAIRVDGICYTRVSTERPDGLPKPEYLTCNDPVRLVELYGATLDRLIEQERSATTPRQTDGITLAYDSNPEIHYRIEDPQVIWDTNGEIVGIRSWVRKKTSPSELKRAAQDFQAALMGCM